MIGSMRVIVCQYEGIDVTPALPLAAGCLVASARADTELTDLELAIELERRPLDHAVEACADPDVLGLSLYPWNAAYSLAVAERARASHPDCLIIVGGPAVPRRPQNARRFLDDNPAIDVLVFSEGEVAFRQLLRAHTDGSPFTHIGGIAIARGLGDTEHIFTSPPERVHEFSPTASPYLDGTFDEVMRRYGDRLSMALCETNRGCPFSCTFCDWSLTKHVVEFPIERVHAELQWATDRGFRLVMMADANFGIRPRDADIARYIASLRAKTGSPSSFYYYLTKNDHARNLEVIDILHEADIGCWVGLAVQDFDDHVLESVKRDNIQSGESMKLREICGDRDIPTFNELMLGLPGQTYDSFTRTVAEAMPGLPRHDFVLYLCRMIDNTELGDPASREQFAIETRRCKWKTSTPDWDPIVDEFQEVVVGTRDLPLDDWKRTYRYAFLAAALYNLRLLRVVLHHVADLGIDLRAYIERLAERTIDAPAGSVYERLGAVVDRYIDSILSGGPFVMPIDADSAAPVYVDTALATTALARYDAFLAETEKHTADLCGADTLSEAFAYQSLIIPRWEHNDPVVVDLEHDWPTYIASGGTGAPLVSRPTPVRFVPPAFTRVASFAAFATTHFSCIRAKLDVGVVEERGPRRLYVLPASG
jgi:radical SAM superfamily enzyme YgiQ (UPF0313 family)